VTNVSVGTIRVALVRNTLWYGLVTVFGLGAGLVMSIVLARGLGPARMGEYSYLLWALRVLTALAILGWPSATVRYTAAAYARGDSAGAWGYVRFLLRRQLVTTTVVVALVLAGTLLFVESDMRLPFVVLALMLVPVSIEAVYTHAVYGAQRYDLTTQTSTVKMVLHLLASIVAVAAGLDILGLVVGLTFGSTVACVMQRRQARAVLGGAAVEPPVAARGELRGYVASLAVVAVLDTLVRDRSEVFFLKMFTAPEQIAYYSLAFGLATRLMVIPEIAVGGLFPALSALHGGGDRAEFERVYRTAMRYVALAGLPIAALVAALAPNVVHWLYGPAYLPVANLLTVLAVVAVVGALRKVAASGLQAVGDGRCALVSTAVAVAVNVALAATLIPSHGTEGALVANTAAQAVAAGWAFVGMARRHGARLPGADLAKIALATVPLFLAAHAIVGDSHELARVVAATLGGGAVFVIAALALRVVGPRDWTLLMSSTRRILAARAGGV
jgi:O-antigen/teichoic acid export membrane protein